YACTDSRSNVLGVASGDKPDVRKRRRAYVHQAGDGSAPKRISLRLTGAEFPNKQRNSAESELLHARSARVGLGLIDDDAVIEIADAQRDVVHQLRDFAHVLVLDALRL